MAMSSDDATGAKSSAKGGGAQIQPRVRVLALSPNICEKLGKLLISLCLSFLLCIMGK